MNVTELARKLKMPTSKLLEKLPEWGFDIGKRAIKIDDHTAQKIIEGVQKRIYRLYDEPIKKDLEEKIVEEGVVKEISIPAKIRVRDFADKLNIPINRIVMELMKNSIFVAMNEEIDFTTASIIAEDLGFKVNRQQLQDTEAERSEQMETKLQTALAKNEAGKCCTRPPVVVIMGHVDHGKTKLLDTIRETNVMEGEAGGITQHIGAYQIQFTPEKHPELAKDGLRPKITFIDTPGHEAFMAMRSRGAQVADIAILVIAADDGIQPQTLEALNTIQKAGLPFVIAINKIDKPEADIEKIKTKLTEMNLTPEDWGGKVITQPISAKTGQGVKDLLETVLLVAEMEKDKIIGQVDRPAVGSIIESYLDKGEGPVATVLIHTGTLRVGDLVTVGSIPGKVKAMKDFKGKPVIEAGPSMPVKIIGLKNIPEVGDILEVIEDAKEVKKLIKQVKNVQAKRSALGIEKVDAAKQNNINVILKADTVGSLEAIIEALNNLKHKQIGIKIVAQGIGAITETDVLRAEASGALLLGFNISIGPGAKDLAQEKNVDLKSYKIIYELVDHIKANMMQNLEKEIVRTHIGTIQILAVFRTNKDGQIVGGKVTKGIIKTGLKASVSRSGQLITEGKIEQIQAAKEVINEVAEGQEAGFQFVGEPIIKIGDLLEIYREEEKEITI